VALYLDGGQMRGQRIPDAEHPAFTVQVAGEEGEASEYTYAQQVVPAAEVTEALARMQAELLNAEPLE
jgi:hypothetical protein